MPGSDRRNLWTVMLESVPQLYLQAYILFALGAYGQTFKVMSVCSSVLSLAGSSVMVCAVFSEATSIGPARLSRVWPGKVLAMLFMATDAAARCMGFAMVLSEPVRAYGLPTCVTFFLICSIYPLCLPKKDPAMVLTVPYLVLLAVLLTTGKQHYRESGLEIVQALRYMENLLFGILAGAFGQTACGNSLALELGIYFGMLVANAVALISLQCFVDDDGEFRRPRQSTYSPRQIVFGRPMERMPDTE